MRKKYLGLGMVLLTVFLAGCSKNNETANVSVNSDNIVYVTQENVLKNDKNVNVNLEYTSKYPDYYKDEINKKINVLRDKIGSKDVSYIFISDLHMDNNEDTMEAAYRQLYAVVDIANNSDVDFVCVGGDLIDGRHAEANGKQNAMNIVNSVSEVLKNCKKPVLILKGNHDDNSFSAQINGELLYDAEYIMNNNDWYSCTMANFTQYATDYQNGYYYYDLKDKNTRVICLNMSDSSDAVVNGEKEEMGMYFYGYKDAQVEWLANKALSNKEYNYIILNHDLYGIKDQFHDDSNYDNIHAILKAANTHDKFTSSIVTKDFSDFKGKLLAYNAGHFHVMRRIISSEMGNLPLINTELSKSEQEVNWTVGYGVEGFNLHERKKNTITEACFDIVVIKDDTKNVNIYRFGAGEDGELKVSN